MLLDLFDIKGADTVENAERLRNDFDIPNTVSERGRRAEIITVGKFTSSFVGQVDTKMLYRARSVI